MNLLIDPIFRAQMDRGLEQLSLPALLAGYGQGRVHQLVGMQRHQHDSFHVFLCYLAGAILTRLNDRNPVQDEDYWKDGLLSLAGEAGMDAWRLVVEDATRPGFMQAPLPSNGLKPTSTVTTPDELDVLQTAKNHDVKRMRADAASLDTWAYSLISLQTMSGFLGSGNQGISRMNKGFGNRSVVEVTRTRNLGKRWCDAVLRLLEHKEKVLNQDFGFDPNGLVLVWLAPWDGEKSLELKELDPFYVEVCRRVRLKGDKTSLVAQLYSAKQPRIAAKELAGVVGDPWLPMEGATEGMKALTFPPAGITAEHMRRILFSDKLELHSLQKPLPSWQDDLWLSVSVLVRGQGITDGFYVKEVRIPKRKVSLVFGGSEESHQLAALSKAGIEYAGAMKNKVLKNAVFSYILGAPMELKWDHKFATSIWRNVERRYETLWSDQYFPWLLSLPENFEEEEALRSWLEILQTHAVSIIQDVEESLPNHTGRQYRVKTEVRTRFWGAYYRVFPFMRGEKVEQIIS